MDENQEEVQLTQEELESRKQEMIAFYKEQIEFLTIQRDYEKLLTEIDEAKLKRLTYMMQFANIQTQMNGPQEDPPQKDQPAKSEGPKERTLRKT